MRDAIELSRRDLLKVGAAGVLTIGFHWAGTGRAWAAEVPSLAPNAFVRVGSDDSVVVIAKHVEMG
jgi:isoquinoline 1-oxidoreductase beta subunit